MFPELQPALDNISYLAKRLKDDLNEVSRTLTLRDDFVANASHELRSPLTSVMGFAEMLDEGMADSPEECELCVRMIRSECQRMLDVIEDILHLSRAGGKPVEEPQNVNVGNIAREIATSLSAQAAQKGIAISVEGDMVRMGVERDFWEMLYNLAGNAVRYGARTAMCGCACPKMPSRSRMTALASPRNILPPHLRAVLPRGRGARHGARRHRAGPVHRAGAGGALRGAGDGSERNGKGQRLCHPL